MAIRVGKAGQKRHFVRQPKVKLKSSEANSGTRCRKKPIWWEIRYEIDRSVKKINVNGPKKLKIMTTSQHKKWDERELARFQKVMS